MGERGDNRWEEISYEQAMDEIAAKLKTVIDQYGPEGFAVSTSGWNTQTTQSADPPMNLIGQIDNHTAAAGSPMAGIYCLAIIRKSWTPIYNMIEAARDSFSIRGY